MIVKSLCTTCFQPYTLLVQPSDLELVKQIAINEGRSCPCPRLCGGEINLTGEPIIPEGKLHLRDPVELTGRQLFQAVNGLGLPDEVPKDLTVIDSLLKAYKVLAADVQEFDGNFYLHNIQLEGGVTMHLTSGARGARILKITRERA